MTNERLTKQELFDRLDDIPKDVPIKITCINPDLYILEVYKKRK